VTVGGHEQLAPGDGVDARIAAIVVRAVLHALRVGGFMDIAAVSARSGLPAELVSVVLDAAEARGWVIHRTGRLVGWNLTGPGRSEGERLLAAEADAAGVRHRVEDAYRGFLALNREFLDLCTDWQLRVVDDETCLNDHSDVEHDAEVLARLEATHVQVVPLLDELSRALPRFGPYSDRLGSALERVRLGHTEWFTKPVIDSYHTVWFELHEDLLATLGIERSAERVG
jgi:hypothetical protein